MQPSVSAACCIEVSNMGNSSNHEERWITVPGYDGMYLVSSFGRVYSRHVNRQMSTPLTKNGYPRLVLCLDGKCDGWLLHRLVLTSFVGVCPTGCEGAHWDGDRSNSRLENLRWTTPTDNQADRIRHGTTNRGSLQGASKLKKNQILKIRASSKAGSCLARKYGVTQQTICDIRKGRSWRWLND